MEDCFNGWNNCCNKLDASFMTLKYFLKIDYIICYGMTFSKCVCHETSTHQVTYTAENLKIKSPKKSMDGYKIFWTAEQCLTNVKKTKQFRCQIDGKKLISIKLKNTAWGYKAVHSVQFCLNGGSVPKKYLNEANIQGLILTRKLTSVYCLVVLNCNSL